MPKLFRTIKRKMSYKSHNCKECNWKRSAGENEPLLKQWNRLSKTKVALKVLKDSQNISSEFLEELHLNLQRGSTYVVKCLGFTQEPKSKDYAM
ncbi:6486_t:CDS:2, partial [Funneliformis caledonium]